jgi:ParB family chromosome partitioning protein
MSSRPKATDRGQTRERVDSLFGKSVFFGQGGQTRRILDLPLATVGVRGEQPRRHFDEASLEELAQSIRAYGLLQPVLVQPAGEERYMLIAGERRLQACQKLGLERIPAILTDGDPDHVALIENLQRQDLAPLEEAEALERLRQRHAHSLDDLARVVGKSPTLLSETLSLCSLPESVKANLRKEGSRYTRSILVELARIRDPVRQAEAWETLGSGEATVRTLRSLRKRPAERTAPMRSKGLLLRALSRCNAALDSTITSGAQPTARELERLRALRAALDIAIETWTRLPSATRQQKAEV